jgi:uncharacterized protein YcaQ
MRAPARAQDLILAHRVAGYRAGDLERRYPQLAIEEAYFVNYGFLPRETAALLHPRESPFAWDAPMQKRAAEVLAFVRRHGPTRSKDVRAHFDHGRVRRWGGDLNVSTHLLEGLHHRGLLRVARRESGARVYESVARPQRKPAARARLERAGRLLDLAVRLYAPLPAPSLTYLARLVRLGAPHLARELRELQEDAGSRYAHAEVDGVSWFWPSDENPAAPRHGVDDRMRFLTPFDPVVWDRRRFRMFWAGNSGWRRTCRRASASGPLRDAVLWGEQVIGWGNLKVVDGRLRHELGFAGAPPRGRAFRRALDEALERIAELLAL